jgi:uncharacterized membrane protein
LKRTHGGHYGAEFASPEGACAVMVRLESLPGEEQPLRDADVVSWELGQKMSAHHALYNTKKAGESSGGFWGLLFSLVFSLLGLSAGTASQAASGVTSGHRDQRLLLQRRSGQDHAGHFGAVHLRVGPTRHSTGAADKFRDTDAEIIRTSLSKEHEAGLREASARDERPNRGAAGCPGRTRA